MQRLEGTRKQTDLQKKPPRKLNQCQMKTNVFHLLNLNKQLKLMEYLCGKDSGIRALDKREYLMIIFLISHRNHIL